MASCYLLVRGRVRVSRRGVVLGEAESGSLVGLEALLSQDQMGLGVVAVTDVLALQLDADTLLGILGDQFPLVHDRRSAAPRGGCWPSSGGCRARATSRRACSGPGPPAGS